MITSLFLNRNTFCKVLQLFVMRLYDDISNILTIFMDGFIQDEEIDGCQNQAKVPLITSESVNFKCSFLLLLISLLRRRFCIALSSILFELFGNVKSSSAFLILICSFRNFPIFAVASRLQYPSI